MSTGAVRTDRTLPPAPADPAEPATWREVPAAFWCMLAALLLNIFSGYWKEMGVPLGPDRLLMAGGLLLLLLTPGLPRPRAHVLHGALLVFAAWTAASAVLHGALDTTSIYALLDRVIVPFLLFACAPMFLAGRLQRLAFLRSFTLLGVYLTITTLLEAAGALGLLFPRYIAVLKTAPEMADNAARAGGPFASGEANGMALALCAITAFLLARHDRGFWRVLGLIVGTFAIAASILSLTRSIWLGVLLALAVVVLTRRALWRWVPLIAVAGAVIALVGLGLMPDVAQNMAERGSTSRSLDDRANSNAAAVRAIADNPVTGVGWAQFVHVGPDWVRQADDYPITTVNIEVHNVILSRAAELGLPAAALFVAILLLGPVAAVRRRFDDPEREDWRTAALAALIVWFVPAMTSPIPYPFPTFVFFTLAGLVWAFPRPGRATPTQE